MAKAMARGGAGAAARGMAGKGGGLAWGGGMASGMVLTFATASALLLAAMALPVLVGAVLDRSARRRVTRAAALSAFAFMPLPLWHLWQQGETMAAALAMVLDPAVLLPPWMATAVGWALCEVLTVGLRVWADVQAAQRVAALEAEAKAIRETWDIEGLDG